MSWLVDLKEMIGLRTPMRMIDGESLEFFTARALAHRKIRYSEGAISGGWNGDFVGRHGFSEKYRYFGYTFGEEREIIKAEGVRGGGEDSGFFTVSAVVMLRRVWENYQKHVSYHETLREMVHERQRMESGNADSSKSVHRPRRSRGG